LLLVKRKPLGDPRRAKGDGKGLGKFLGLPQQSSWQQDEIPNVDTWENEIAIMSNLRGRPALKTLFRPSTRKLVGNPNGSEDERPLAVVEIKHPFWMGCYEVTNEQYRQFDPSHDSRFEHKGSWVFWEHHLGWPLDGPKPPSRDTAFVTPGGNEYTTSASGLSSKNPLPGHFWTATLDSPDIIPL